MFRAEVERGPTICLTPEPELLAPAFCFFLLQLGQGRNNMSVGGFLGEAPSGEGRPYRQYQPVQVGKELKG